MHFLEMLIFPKNIFRIKIFFTFVVATTIVMLSILEYQDFYNLLTGRTPQAFNRVLNKNFRQNGVELTKEQWSILAVLWENDGCSQQYLADKSFRDRPSVTRLIDNMEKDGLVDRKPDVNDRRSNLIFLTKKGKQIQEKVMSLVNATVEESIKGISVENIVTVKEVFHKIYQNLEVK